MSLPAVLLPEPSPTHTDGSQAVEGAGPSSVGLFRQRAHGHALQVLMAFDAKDKKIVLDQPASNHLSEVGDEARASHAGACKSS